MDASEIEGINSIGNSVLVSCHVWVVRASGRARRIGAGASGACVSNAADDVGKILIKPGDLGAPLS